jgi:hypothetical protein
MARPKKVDMYICIEGGVTNYDGEQVSVQAGDLVRAGHPILKGREWMFKPAQPEDYIRFDHEQATDAPGETRENKPAASEKAAPKTTEKAK